jgi:hypothetical protein
MNDIKIYNNILKRKHIDSNENINIQDDVDQIQENI